MAIFYLFFFFLFFFSGTPPRTRCAGWLHGGNGGGGSYKGVTVVGGKFGLDMRQTGSAPTYVGIALHNQSCTAILQGSASTATISGLKVSNNI